MSCPKVTLQFPFAATPMPSFVRDFSFAARSLARRPAFTLVALLTLSLGIGANTAVFSVVNGIVLNPLPYREPGRLVAFGNYFISNAELLYMQQNLRTMSQVASYSPGWGMALTSGGEPSQVTSAKVSTNFLAMLRVTPMRGRDFAADESTPGRDRVALVDFAYWQTRFGGDAGIIGQSVTLDGQPYAVVGILPRGFAFYTGTPAHFIVPMAIDPTSRFHRGQNALAFARLTPSATFTGAQAELRTHIPLMRDAFAFAPDYGRDMSIVSLQDYLVGPVRRMLFVILGAVGFIVLIAAANVGNLLLVRTSERRREIAVRVALGASRWRVIRELTTESLLLASGGSVAGLALALAGVAVLRGLLPANTPRLLDVSVDGRVLLLCASVGALTGLVGLLPAIVATREDPQHALRSGRGSDPAGRRGQRLRGAFVATEVALAVVLVVGAGLMLRTLQRLSDVNPGFQVERALTFRLQPTGGRLTTAAQTRQYFDQVMERVRALPGVTAVGGIHHLPMGGYSWQTSLTVEGRPPAAGEAPPRPGMRIISGDYLRAMGIPLESGRAFETQDVAGNERVVLINSTLARQLFPNEDPIGRRIRGGNVPDTAFARIVGVVGDVRHQSLDVAPMSEVFFPLAQYNMSFQAIVVRTSVDPMALLEPVRDAVREIDGTVPIVDLRTFEAAVKSSMARRRVVLQLLSVFAIIGLVLGAIGVYGVVAYAVTQRTQEIGVRLALGAPRRSIVAMVVRSGLGYTLAGLIVGLLGALALARTLQGLVYDVSTTDPLTYAAVAVSVLAVSLLASWIPARRASLADPVLAMRRDS
jgi:putative ABC transport system permease protein